MSADPHNPKVGDVFVTAVGTRRTITAVGKDFVRAVDEHGLEYAFALAYVAGYWKPAPTPWPEPPVRWGVQRRDRATAIHTENDARDIVAEDPDNRRLVRYIPEAVES